MIDSSKWTGARRPSAWTELRLHLQSIGFALSIPFLVFWGLVMRLADIAIRLVYGPCGYCNGTCEEKWPDEDEPRDCSMCDGHGHSLAAYRTMKQIEADAARGGPGGCCCLECSLAKGYDV